MKIIYVLFILLATVMPSYAQPDIDPGIIDALSKGNAVALSAHFNENIELVLGTTNNVFSKKQATGIVADFFRKNKVTSFQVLHKGAKENSAFTICTLRSGSSNYRVYVLVRKTADEKQLIQQLRIELSND